MHCCCCCSVGIGLGSEYAQVRIRYKQKPHNKLITAMSGRGLRSNELVMRIQPDESLYMTTMSKVTCTAARDRA